MTAAPRAYFVARHARLVERLRAESLDALLVTSLSNLAYLTGLFASAGALLCSAESLELVVDGRYVDAADERKRDLPALAIVEVPSTAGQDEIVARAIGRLGARRVGFEARYLSVESHQALTRRLGAAGHAVDLVPTSDLVEDLRVVKDAWELATLREAAGRLSAVAKCIIPKVLAGMVEREVAAAIEAEMRRVGFERLAFDTIVASGPNGARPHYRAGDRRLEPGDLVVLDFGGRLNGYAVDLTRTLALPPVGRRARRLIEQVSAAQAAAFAGATPGRRGSEVDQSARDVLAAAGLADAFSHGTGHGLGLDVHERPRLVRRRAEGPDETLRAGMVITIEPGAYFPGWGGARIEDDAAVTPEGPEWLTEAPRF